MAEELRNNKHALRTCLLYEWLKNPVAAAVFRNVNAVLGEGTVSHSTATEWCKRFSDGDYNFTDKDRSCRPQLNIDTTLRRSLSREPGQSLRTLATQVGTCPTTVKHHLKNLGYTAKYGQKIPHDLTNDQLEMRVSIATSLISRSRTTTWFRYIVTGDEKWCLYVNHTHKRQWLPEGENPVAETSTLLHEKKILISVFWDRNGVVHWETLPDNSTVTANIYCEQLETMVTRYHELRPENDKLLLLVDNARPHIAKKSQEKMKELGIELLPHPPYSPDMAPTDYHLFRSLQSHLADKRFDDRKHLIKYLEDYFLSLTPEFFARGIDVLMDRWHYIAEHDGAYVNF